MFNILALQSHHSHILSNALSNILRIVLLICIFLYFYFKSFSRKSNTSNSTSKDTDVYQPAVQPSISQPHDLFNPKLRDKPFPSSTEEFLHQKIDTDVSAIIATNLKSHNYTSIQSQALRESKLDKGLYKRVLVASILENNGSTFELIDIVSTDAAQNNRWKDLHNTILTSTIRTVKAAIDAGYHSINIGYDYDGVWAYAAGYWPINDDEIAQNYLDRMNELSQDIDIYFTKISYVPQLKFLDMIEQVNKSVFNF